MTTWGLIFLVSASLAQLSLFVLVDESFLGAGSAAHDSTNDSGFNCRVLVAFAALILVCVQHWTLTIGWLGCPESL